MPASIIMVIRHAEKPDSGNVGVQLDGSQDADSLIVQGWQRAGALAVLFDPARSASRPRREKGTVGSAGARSA